MKTSITVVFTVPDKGNEEAIESVREALESQPYSWEMTEAFTTWLDEPQARNYCPVCGQPDNCGDCNHAHS